MQNSSLVFLGHVVHFMKTEETYKLIGLSQKKAVSSVGDGEQTVATESPSPPSFSSALPTPPNFPSLCSIYSCVISEESPFHKIKVLLYSFFFT